MNISEINHIAKASKKPRRVGRGPGSGRGKTSQRGYNGQGSRSGSSMNPVFEGGQMPLVRRIPKRGFNNKGFADVVVAVNVGDLELVFESTDAITPALMEEKGVVKKVFDQIKILGDGELTKALNVAAHKFSASALEKIKAAGGTVNVLPEKKPVVKNKMGSRRKAAQAAAAERKANGKGKDFPKKSAKKTVKTPRSKK